MIAPTAAKAVPPKNLRLLASTPRSTRAAFFPAMIVLPCCPTFGRFSQPGFAIPAGVEYLRFAAVPQDRREVALRLPVQSVSIGNDGSFAHSPIEPS